MFSNTAYEALYQYLGLELHVKSIEIITSQKIFGATILMIFGWMFFITSVQFFSRYLPGSLVQRKSVPLSRYVKIIACLFLGVALLQARSSTTVKRFNGDSWHHNAYIHGQLRAVEPQYKVSLVFDLLSRTAEEFAALLGRVVDKLVGSTHSQLDTPNFFFKAIMYGASASVDDPDLRRSIRFYTEECFDRLLPLVKEKAKENKLDGFFADKSIYDDRLKQLTIETPDRTPYTCLDAKQEVSEGLKLYALAKSKDFGQKLDQTVKPGIMNSNTFTNLEVSSLLVDYYLDQHEGPMGVQKGSQIEKTGGRIAQYLNRLVSVDGLMSVFGMKNLQGMWMTAARSKEFNENLARAPHVAGFIKMIAIGIFPWLIFFVVAGRWKVLYVWFLTYFSVLLWTPIWVLLYHIMVGISLSSEMMESLGKLGDGVSLYSAELVTSRIYHLFEVYSWLQLSTGAMFTGSILYFLAPLLRDGKSETAPEFIDGATSVVSAAKVVL